MKRKRLIFLLVGLAVFSCVSTGNGSCSADIGAYEHGDLATGTFSYTCVDEVLDPVCENMLGTPPLPPFQKEIAVGATFTLWFLQHDSAPNNMEPLLIQSPFESQLERTYEDGLEKLRFLVPCLSPVHATNYDDAVYDFLHIEGVEVNHLLLAKQKEGVEKPWASWDTKWEELGDEIVLEPEQTALIRVFPRDKEEEILPGVITEYEWTPPDESIALMSPTSAITNVLITGIAVGTTTMEVELNGLTKTINVVVEGNLDGGPDAGDHSSTEGGGAK